VKKLAIIFLAAALILGGAAAYGFSQRADLVAGRIKTDLKLITGADVDVKGVSVRLHKPFGATAEVFIQRIKLKNTPNYKIPNLAMIKNVRMTLQTLPFLMGKWMIGDLEAHIKRVAVQINDEGVNNLATIPALNDPAGSAVDGFGVDSLKLQFGKIYYLDFSNAAAPVTELKDLKGKTEIFQNIKNPGVLLQAPVLTLINELNRGSLGLPRGKIMETVALSTAQNVPSN
jgi:hypothetical protein